MNLGPSAVIDSGLFCENRSLVPKLYIEYFIVLGPSQEKYIQENCSKGPDITDGVLVKYNLGLF